jgi:hypothetical protein
VGEAPLAGTTTGIALDSSVVIVVC